MKFISLALISVATASCISASTCKSGSSGLAEPVDLLKMADDCQLSEMSESIADVSIDGADGQS